LLGCCFCQGLLPQLDKEFSILTDPGGRDAFALERGALLANFVIRQRQPNYLRHDPYKE